MTIAGSIGSKLWAATVPWTRSHSTRALTSRIQPRTVSAGTPLFGADCAMALAKGSGQQGLPDDVDHVAAMRGCSRGEQDVSDPASGATDPSWP